MADAVLPGTQPGATLQTMPEDSATTEETAGRAWQSEQEPPELELSATDLQNLVRATEIAAVFLDRELRIKRFTPAARETFKLTPADIGRKLSEVTDRLADEGLVADAEKVLEEETPRERELRVAHERWVLTRLAPYRAEDNRVAGVVAAAIDITERKRAENELREAAAEHAAQLARFHTIMRAVPDFVYQFDLEGRFTYVSQSLLDLWQKRAEEAIGRNFHELDYPPELAAKLHGQIREVIEKGEQLKDETPYTSAAGARMYEYIFFPLLSGDGSIEGVGGVTRDITDRKQAEQSLRESDERFRLLVEGARDYAMFLLDAKGAVTFWSSGAERVFGWTREEAIGQSGAMIFTPEDRARGGVEEEIETALTEGRAPDRRFHLRKDGSRFWADGVLMRIDTEKGQLRGFAKVARDATDQRRVEDELRHARDEMEQRVIERTQDVMASKTELERTISERQRLEKELLETSERERRRIGEDLHDIICQELTATALFLRSSAKKVASESSAGAETLEEAAQIVNRNVGLARDLARGLQPADLKGTGLKQALRSLAEQACENREIQCHFKADRGARVSDDSVALHLYRVAQEALTNAVKHSGAKHVLITLGRDKEAVCVSVQDDGKGFSPKRKSKGLGLHIMRYRANALGGKLKIEKRASGGMAITCVIPLKK